MSDIAISASVVVLMIVGLIIERFNTGLFDRWGGTLLDAMVAFGIVIYFSIIGIRLMRTSIDELMDRTSEDLVRRVMNIASSVPGVASVKDVRARRVGSMAHVEVTISVSDHLSISEAHDVADNVESAVKHEIGQSIVMVHVEPELREKIEKILAGIRDPLIVNIHDLDIINSHEIGIIVSMHVVVKSNARLSSINRVIGNIENNIRQAVPNARVWVHLEPDNKDINITEIRKMAEAVSSKYGGHVGDVHVINIEGMSVMWILVYLPPDMSVSKAHDIATEIENEIARSIVCRTTLPYQYYLKPKIIAMDLQFFINTYD
ncbi:cation transporter dimerization domain-containing protein [Vulcanisaeta souniana]|uniref:cation transporter dimerization domain-containing protein n=1 Tax=Vulcanisaeta souniana TaxID=164452 RepID=UPI000A6C9054|nr:cation transporter dimerization domain-containing protein [Vulcanisaeta souniana]